MRRVISALHKDLTGGELTSLTVREHVNAWLSRRKREISPNSYAFYQHGAGRLLSALDNKADTEIHEITKADLVKFRDSLDLAPKTINHIVKLTRMIFADAKRDELIVDNPAEFLSTVINKKSGAKARRPFTVDELKKVLSVAEGEWESMILCAMYTGQRLGDIANLRWSNFDLRKDGEGMVRIITGKTGRQIAIPVAGPLERHLKSLVRPQDPDAYLHPEAAANVAARGRTGHLSNRFTALLAKAGLREARPHRKKGEKAERERSPLTFHSIRGTATSFLHEAGVPPAVAQEIIGHDSAEIHAIYTTMGDKIMRDSVNKLPDVT